MTKYQEYQLQWMIDQGYSLADLINGLNELAKDAEPGTTVQELFNEWELDSGFNGSLWVCEDEWKMNEGAEPTDDDYRKFGFEQMEKQGNGADPDTLISFDHGDQSIVNPFVDASARFDLNFEEAVATYGDKNVREWCEKARKVMEGE